jgi:hypothetical protein
MVLRVLEGYATKTTKDVDERRSIEAQEDEEEQRDERQEQEVNVTVSQCQDAVPLIK